MEKGMGRKMKEWMEGEIEGWREGGKEGETKKYKERWREGGRGGLWTRGEKNGMGGSPYLTV